MFKQVVIATAMLVSLSFSVYPQPQAGSGVTQEMRTAANDAYQKQNWAEAAKNFDAIIKLEPKNGGAHYRQGISYLNLQKNDDALRVLLIANTISPNPIYAFAISRAYARLQNKAKVYEVLESTVPMGGIQASQLEAEPDFKELRTEPRFIEVVKKTDLAANPCKSKPEFRQFDFWIGEWLPKNAQGVTVGTSSIQLILSSCVIFENWNTPITSGKSFSNFDSTDGKWHQTWVDDKGTLAFYVGGMANGKMVLDNERVVNGKKTIGR
ncbi:MAG: tetratricopeptide repeat protein, partial [Pyrinomonadaceae bacterium]